MKLNDSLLGIILRTWHCLDACRSRQIIFLSVLSLFVTFLDLVSIGSVYPLLVVIASPEKILGNELVKIMIQEYVFIQPANFQTLMIIAFIILATIAGMVRIIHMWVTIKISTSVGHDLTCKVYRQIISKPYSFHLTKNSSELIEVLNKTNGMVAGVIQPTLAIVSNLALIFSLVFTILYFEPYVAGTAIVAFVSIYAAIYYGARNSLSRNSGLVAYHRVRMTQAVQESVGGIRDVIIDGLQVFYQNIYAESLKILNKSNAENQTIALTPKYAVETVGIVCFAGAALFISQTADPSNDLSGSASLIAILGVLAMSAQRLLPAFQQTYFAISVLKGSKASSIDALAFLEDELDLGDYPKDRSQLRFRSFIKLENVSFRYASGDREVLSRVSLTIPYKSRIGIIGATGSGKSTLLDLIMGLIEPVSGRVFVDTSQLTVENVRAWQANLAHVPQFIYLTDSTIAENIAFGVTAEQIDYKRLETSIQKSQLLPAVEKLEKGYLTIVGERGVRMSGGERQRIGIARALYKQPSLLILDEATSALDEDTESKIIDTIETLGDITVIIVTHRLNTIKTCDVIYRLDSGTLSTC